MILILLNLKYVGTNLIISSVVTNVLTSVITFVIPLWTLQWCLNIFLFFRLIYISANATLTKHYFEMDIFMSLILKIFETLFRCRFLSNTLLWPVILKLLF